MINVYNRNDVFHRDNWGSGSIYPKNRWVLFLKQVVGSTFQYVAQRSQIVEFYSRGLVVYYAVEVLVTQPQLNIKPILCFSFFF